MNQIFFSPRNR